MKIFIGSSSENLEIAKSLEALILDIDESLDLEIDILGWWEEEAFPRGKSFYESLLNIVEDCNTAILIAGEEDIRDKRDLIKYVPRDNVILELGLFAGKHGRERALLAKIGNPELPQI